MNIYIVLRNGVFLGILSLLSVLDLSERRIPDRIILVAVSNWLLISFILRQPISLVLLQMAAGVFFGVCVLLVSLITELILKKECLGGGDIKLLFVVCLYLGFWHTFYALGVACVLVLMQQLLKGKTGMFPFAPAIAAGACIVMCVWEM
ncbi:MAG: prepilin peptidase [Lachnospiraceae bacterium]|nr:prepilin peptidase [Lachnospiraceae bacterium]